MKKALTCLLALCLLLSVMPVVSLAADVTVSGNFAKITTGDDFAQGTMTNLSPAAVGDGAVVLDAGCAEGEFISAVYQTAHWNDLVASWNTDTPRGTSVEVYGRAYIPEYDGWTDPEGTVHDGWTDWITWGEWSPFIERGCPHDTDSHLTKNGKTKEGWAYGYSYTGYGDSSLNICDELTANAFQLKAVLRADGTQEAQPVLRLLAATFKNTNDENWWDACTLPEEKIEEKESVLLDTPAISQMIRDPDYGNVICSATSMTMLLDGRGEDLLPEDVALMSFDYGFGGNGNWSFTCAAAGAYGYESYVHYSSFEGLRQELSRGYGVALSVKYSNSTTGKYPYLENAPTSTGGHLITIVGYYFNEDLGEYVYYSNDPATGSDAAVAHREYRESQLSQAWYRRAAYLVHDKEEGAGQYARTYHYGDLWPLEGRPGVYALVTEDMQVLQLPQDFIDRPRQNFGEHGTLAMIVAGEEAELPEGVRRVTANHDFFYNQVDVTEDGYLELTEGLIPELLAEGTPPTVYVIFNSGDMYIANPTAEAPTYVPGMELTPPAVEETPAAPQAPAADAQQPESGSSLIIVIAVAAVAAVAVAIVLFTRKKK